MTFTRRLASLLLVGGVALAQGPAFEVAAVKVTDQDFPVYCDPCLPNRIGFGAGSGIKMDGARVDVANMSLDQLILAAYRLKPWELSGPEWMMRQHFEIRATTPEGATKAQVPEMLQALLAERFKLTIHREAKQQPVYALVVAKGGPKLKEPTVEAFAPAKELSDSHEAYSSQGPVQLVDTDQGIVVTGGPGGPRRMKPSGRSGLHMELLATTMPGFAALLSQYMDRPVVDMTDLKGRYQLEFDVALEDIAPLGPMLGRGAPDAGGAGPAAASDPSGSIGVSKSVEKLGLRLERRNAPIDTMVVDRLERTPTSN